VPAPEKIGTRLTEPLQRPFVPLTKPFPGAATLVAPPPRGACYGPGGPGCETGAGPSG
jgi:hypothetical protein